MPAEQPGHHQGEAVEAPEVWALEERGFAGILAWFENKRKAYSQIKMIFSFICSGYLRHCFWVALIQSRLEPNIAL